MRTLLFVTVVVMMAANADAQSTPKPGGGAALQRGCDLYLSSVVRTRSHPPTSPDDAMQIGYCAGMVRATWMAVGSLADPIVMHRMAHEQTEVSVRIVDMWLHMHKEQVNNPDSVDAVLVANAIHDYAAGLEKK